MSSDSSIDDMKKLMNSGKPITKSSKYWEEEFSSGKFSENQIKQLLEIDLNKYDYVKAIDYGFNSNLIFEIPLRKNLRNKFLHKPDMYDAIYAFFDPNMIEEYDEEHSTEDEDRFKVTGMSKNSKIVNVIYFERIENSIRIISVFEATDKEVSNYVRVC